MSDEEDTKRPEGTGPSAAASASPRRRRWMWPVVLLLIAAGTVAAVEVRSERKSAAESKAAAGPRPIPVVTATARKGDVEVRVDGLGTVTPLATVTVKSRVDGQVTAIHFQEGQMVAAGDLLAEIDARPFEVQRAQAEGQLARDQALLANAKIDLDRYRTLFEQDSIAEQQVDTQAALVRQYEGAVKVDEGQVADARLQLVYARVTAPISGRLGLRQVDVGNIVHANDTTGIVVITQLQPIDVVFTVPQDDLPRIMTKLNAGAELRTEAFDRAQRQQLAAGVLLTVDNQIDPATGTVRLKARFPNDDKALFPNQFVNARLIVEVKRDATLVPAAAVRRGTQGTFAFVVSPEKAAALHPIQVDVTQGDDVSIASGINPGDQVVVEGADALRDGSVVQLPGEGGGGPGGAGGGKDKEKKDKGEAKDGKPNVAKPG